jgi:hypothetical protein
VQWWLAFPQLSKRRFQGIFVQSMQLFQLAYPVLLSPTGLTFQSQENSMPTLNKHSDKEAVGPLLTVPRVNRAVTRFTHSHTLRTHFYRQLRFAHEFGLEKSNRWLTNRQYAAIVIHLATTCGTCDN